MPDAIEITASQIIESPSPAPVKKALPPWPSDVPVIETYPGSKVTRHPLRKCILSLKQAVELGGKIPVVATAPAPAQATVAPVQTPPVATAQATAQEKPQATAKAAEMPDFSDLNGGPKPAGETEPKNPIDAMASHRTMGGIFHSAIESPLAAVFGERFKSTPDEKNLLIEKWAAALEWWEMRVLNPAEQLAAAYGAYFMGRVDVIVGFVRQKLVTRKARKFVATNQPPVAARAVATDGETVGKVEIRQEGSIFEEGK